MPVEVPNDDVVKVTILKHFASYFPGESAFFSAAQAEALVDEGFVGSSTGLPQNIMVPHATQDGDVLNCTMGTWSDEPTAYSYQWKLDGTNVGTDAASYTVTADDAGKVASCVVTASNDKGATEGPPSNDVVVAAPAT